MIEALAKWRWVLLSAALICGVGFALVVFAFTSIVGSPIFEVLFPAAAPLQALATFAAHARLKALWPTIVGYLAALLWLAAYLTAMAGEAAGPGGLVYGLLIMLPGIALGAVLQLAAALGFYLAERKAR